MVSISLPPEPIRRGRVLAAVLLLGGLLVAVFVAWLSYAILVPEGPGGMRPSYEAVDNDPRLTDYARSALPIIAAIGKYHDQNGEYPNDVTKLGTLLVASKISQIPGVGQDVNGWTYYRVPKSDGFVLSLALGWDPTLAYECKGNAGSWIFDPGDGSPEKTIKLNP
jgi:hypothetical protein